jgi:hypothetical protein
MHFILLYVEFEDGSTISVMKNRAISHKRSQLAIVKFLKKSNVSKARPPDYSYPAPIKNSRGRSRLDALVHVSKMTGTYSKE